MASGGLVAGPSPVVMVRPGVRTQIEGLDDSIGPGPSALHAAGGSNSERLARTFAVAHPCCLHDGSVVAHHVDESDVSVVEHRLLVAPFLDQFFFVHFVSQSTIRAMAAATPSSSTASQSSESGKASWCGWFFHRAVMFWPASMAKRINIAAVA